MKESYLKELASVRTAIQRLTEDPHTSQSVSSANGGSVSVTAMDITRLYAREKELVRAIAELANDGSLGIRYPIYCTL